MQVVRVFGFSFHGKSNILKKVVLRPYWGSDLEKIAAMVKPGESC